MPYRAHLQYFRPGTGKFLADAVVDVDRDELPEIWEAIHELRRMGQLPRLRPNAGRDLLIWVDVPKHPDRRPHLVLPPFVNEEDITPVRIPTGEMSPLVRVPLDEMPRTTTRDVLKIAPEHDDEVTPVDRQGPPTPDDKT